MQPTDAVLTQEVSHPLPEAATACTVPDDAPSMQQPGGHGIGQSAGSQGAQHSAADSVDTVIAFASMLNCENTKANARTAKIGSQERLIVKVNFFIFILHLT